MSNDKEKKRQGGHKYRETYLDQMVPILELEEAGSEARAAARAVQSRAGQGRAGQVRQSRAGRLWWRRGGQTLGGGFFLALVMLRERLVGNDFSFLSAWYTTSLIESFRLNSAKIDFTLLAP